MQTTPASGLSIAASCANSATSTAPTCPFTAAPPPSLSPALAAPAALAPPVGSNRLDSVQDTAVDEDAEVVSRARSCCAYAAPWVKERWLRQLDTPVARAQDSAPWRPDTRSAVQRSASSNLLLRCPPLLLLLPPPKLRPSPNSLPLRPPMFSENAPEDAELSTPSTSAHNCCSSCSCGELSQGRGKRDSAGDEVCGDQVTCQTSSKRRRQRRRSKG
eukprot:257680-Pelagomonas_calceolata.AAC.5